MVIKTIELAVEYMAFVLCIYKSAKRKVKFSLWMFLPFFIEWIYVLWSDTGKISIICKLIVLVGIFLSIKIELVTTWAETIKIFVTGMLTIMSLQLLQFYLFKFGVITQFNIRYEGIIVNINICRVALLWKEKYRNILINGLSKIKSIIILILMLIRIIYLFSQNTYADLGIALQFLFETVGLSVACILWITTENEKSHKTKELQMYEIYNQAFEEAIITIRTRQHEFENHINAIKCMRYTITDCEEVLSTQEQYCEKLLQENKLNRLLKLNVEPVLIGFLYSKITSAEAKGISVKYEIQSVDIKEKIAIYEFIELIGILFDNAVEALEEKECKQIVLNLKLENEKSFYVEIANASPIYTNSEIEKFCTYGYSTKGEKRGVGLTRVKRIAQKYNVLFQIQNCEYAEKNYLSFKLSFI